MEEQGININELPFKESINGDDLLILANTSGLAYKVTKETLESNFGFTQSQISSDLGESRDTAISQLAYTELFRKIESLPNLVDGSNVQSGFITTQGNYTLERNFKLSGGTLGKLAAESGDIVADENYITYNMIVSGDIFKLLNVMSYSAINVEGAVIDFFEGDVIGNFNTSGDIENLLVCVPLKLASIPLIYSVTPYTLAENTIGIVNNGVINTIQVSPNFTFSNSFLVDNNNVLMKGYNEAINDTQTYENFNIGMIGNGINGEFSVTTNENVEGGFFLFDYLLPTLNSPESVIITPKMGVEFVDKWSGNYNGTNSIQIYIKIPNFNVGDVIKFNYLINY